MSIVELTTFLGWCSIINIGLLTLTAIMIIVGREKIAKKHAKMFGLDEKELAPIYFKFIAYYKMVILVLNVVPYIALKIMG